MKKSVLIIILILLYIGIGGYEYRQTIYQYKVVAWVTQRPNIQGRAYLKYISGSDPWQYVRLDNWHLVSGSTNSFTASDEVYLPSGYFVTINCRNFNLHAYSLLYVLNLDTGEDTWIQSRCDAGPTFKINYILP